MKNYDVKQIKQKISKIKCPTHIKAAMYSYEFNKIIKQQDYSITFSEYLNRVHYRLSYTYRYTKIEAKELMQREINTLIKLYENIDKDKIESDISSAAYSLDLMW